MTPHFANEHVTVFEAGRREGVIQTVGSEPYYSDESVTVHAGDCLEVLKGLPDASVDAVVTDPPYG